MSGFPKVLCGVRASLLALVVVSPAMAQWLGEERVVARVGEPLQFTVPARFTAPETGQECASAEVFYGDRQLLTSQVRVTVEQRGESRQVQVLGLRPVDEPRATVVLRVGCGDVFTRRYEVLPESPVLQPPMAQAVAPLFLAGPAATTAARPHAPTSQARPERLSSSRFLAQGAARQPSRAMLRMDLIELPDATRGLRLSTALVMAAADADQRTRSALLWQATRADAQEVARDTTRRQEVEGELVRLRQEAARVQADLAAVRELSLSARGGWGWDELLGIAALIFGTVVVLLLRTGHAGRRERPVVWHGAPATGRAAPAPDAIAPASPQTIPAAPPLPAAELLERDVVAELRPLEVSSLVDVTRPQEEVSPVFSFRPQRVEALLHTFQEMEFLRRLGRTERAVESIQQYLTTANEASPLAYLAWLELCETTGYPQAMESIDVLYADHFGCEPPNRVLLDPAWGLERVPGILAKVSQAWDTPQLPGVIESLLFSIPRGDDGVSLQAGRDLLFLYGLDAAKSGEPTELAAPVAEPEPPSGKSWSPFSPSHEFSGSSRIGFDVDLAALERAPRGLLVAGATTASSALTSVRVP